MNKTSMSVTGHHQSLKKKVIQMLIVPTVLTLIVFAIAYGIWRIDFTAPLNYAWSDDLNHGSLVLRAMHGDLTLWTDEFLGYPYGLKQYAFPHIPWAAVLWAYLCGRFTQNYPFVINSYYILGYCLTTLLFFYAAHKLKISYWVSVFGGLFYAFFQYHELHGIQHLTASSYYAVPLIICICMMICSDEKIQADRKTIMMIVGSSVLISVSDMFYAFWGCMLIGLCGIYAFINKKYKHLGLAAVTLVLIGSVTLLLLSPSIIYGLSHETFTAKRSASETIEWGLKLVSLIIPKLDGHPLSFIKEKYISGGIRSGENIDNYLGIIGIIGMLFLCIIPFVRNTKIREKDNIKKLSILNVLTILIGLSGGIGLVVSVLITSKIRTYNRITVYVLCFAVLGFCMLADELIRRWHLNQTSVIIMLSCLLFVHLIDMQYFSITTNESEWPYKSMSAERYHQDEMFIAALKEMMPEGSKLLYLPYVNFPENKTETTYSNYTRGIITDLFDSGFYSSFGLIYGTTEAMLMETKYHTQDAEQIISYAVSDDFDYVLIDEKILETENYNTLKDELSKLLDTDPILRQDDYTVFPISEDVKARYADVNNNTIMFCEGFYMKEGDDQNWWIWAKKEAKVYIESDEDSTVLGFDLSGYGEKEREIRITGCGVDETYHLLAGENKTVSLVLDLSQDNVLMFESSAENESEGSEARTLNFMIKNWAFTKTEAED